MEISNRSQDPSEEATSEPMSGLQNSHESADYWGRTWNPSPATNSPQSVFSTGTGFSSDWNRSEQSLFNLDADSASSDPSKSENNGISTSLYPSFSVMDDLPEGLEHTQRAPFNAASFVQGGTGSVQGGEPWGESMEGPRKLRCEWKGCTSPFTFRREADLMRHINTIHVNPRAYACPDCGSRFARKDNLQSHMMRHHKHIRGVSSVVSLNSRGGSLRGHR